MTNTDEIQDKLIKALECHKLNNVTEAELLYQEVLELVPDFDVALEFYGALLLQENRFDDALVYLTKASILNPSIETFKDIGDIYVKKNQLNEAIENYSKAVQLDSENPGLNYKIGFLLYQTGNQNEAVKYLNNVLQYMPDFADTHYILGVISQNNNQLEQAAAFYRKALNLNFANEDIHHNLGTVLYLTNKYDEAIECFKKAIDINPNNPELYNSLGTSYQNKNDLKNAVDNYKKAIEITPKPFYQYNLGKALLVTGDFKQGWENFESRIDTFSWHKLWFDPMIKPKWTGESLEGKNILVYYTGGFGDSIQFARYLPVLHSFGAKIICCPQNELLELFRQSDLMAEIIPSDKIPNNLEFDYQLPFFSFGNSLKANIDNIPLKDGFLKAHPEKVKAYKEKYFDNTKFKIGLCWQSTDQPYDLRSIPLSCFNNLSELKDIKLYSLQKGYGSEQIDLMPDKFEIVRLAETFKDFSDTAAAIENLDLIIAVDTAIIHLAGAIGKKTWALIPYVPDWRWLLNKEDSIWYNSVKLFRQKEFGNWEEVLVRIEKSIKCIM